MKFKPGELIDEIIEGEFQSRCLVLSHRKHPVVPWFDGLYHLCNLERALQSSAFTRGNLDFDEYDN